MKHTKLNKGGMYDAIMKYMAGGKYMKEGGTDFGNLSVKAGIDKNPEVTYADKIAGAKMNEKGKGGRVYRMGGVNEMEHGGGLKVLIKAMQEGGMLNMMEHGGVHKYPHGGVHDPVPPGSVQGNQKFRVIPEKSPAGQTELAYYIDGRPVESQVFQQQFYDAGNKPQDLNQLIENSMIAATQGIGAESGISGGSPLEGLLKSYRDGLKERDVYKEKGAAGIDSLYEARKDNYDRMIRQMGG